MYVAVAPASIFCQGNTKISVTRPPTKTKQEREKEREREREREMKRERHSMVLRDHTNDSGYPKRLKLGLQLPTCPVYIPYSYSRIFLHYIMKQKDE